MNFITLRGGYLRLNANEINSIEARGITYTSGIFVTMASGIQFALDDVDASKVLDAIDPPNMTVPDVDAALDLTVDTAAEMKWSEPTSAYASDLTVSHAKPGKRSGKRQ